MTIAIPGGRGSPGVLAVSTFGRLIAQGLLSEAEALPHLEATGFDAWDLADSVDEWIRAQAHAIEAISADVTAMVPCSKAAAFAWARRVNDLEFNGALRDDALRAICRAVWTCKELVA